MTFWRRHRYRLSALRQAWREGLRIYRIDIWSTQALRGDRRAEGRLIRLVRKERAAQKAADADWRAHPGPFGKNRTTR